MVPARPEYALSHTGVVAVTWCWPAGYLAEIGAVGKAEKLDWLGAATSLEAGIPSAHTFTGCLA